MHEKLCPYCGSPVVDGICLGCGSRDNPNYQYFDPIESAWQQGRFLRRLRYGKLIVDFCCSCFYIQSLVLLLVIYNRSRN